MTLSFIIGPIIALVIFIIFITDKWETVVVGNKELVREDIYKRFHYLQKHNIRCKVIRENSQTIAEQSVLKLLVFKKDLDKAKAISWCLTPNR